MSNRVCPWWLAYTFDNPIRAIFHKPEHICASYVKEGMTVADIGCGMGYFSVGLAKIVGKRGRVIAVDIQTRMIEKLVKRARKAGVMDIIQTFQCEPDNLPIKEPLDFALAFWVVHETPDKRKFFEQLYSILRHGGFLLMAEPKLHVSTIKFKQEVDLAIAAGFNVKDEPDITLSNSAVFGKR